MPVLLPIALAAARGAMYAGAAYEGYKGLKSLYDAYLLHRAVNDAQSGKPISQKQADLIAAQYGYAPASHKSTIASSFSSIATAGESPIRRLGPLAKRLGYVGYASDFAQGAGGFMSSRDAARFANETNTARAAGANAVEGASSIVGRAISDNPYIGPFAAFAGELGQNYLNRSAAGVSDSAKKAGMQRLRGMGYTYPDYNYGN